MQICANELKMIMRNVLAKREYPGRVKIIVSWRHVIHHIELFFSPDIEIKTEGFSLETCRSMIALMDVSFQLAATKRVWRRQQSSLMLPWPGLLV